MSAEPLFSVDKKQRMITYREGRVDGDELFADLLQLWDAAACNGPANTLGVGACKILNQRRETGVK
jgi:hypothetical protein